MLWSLLGPTELARNTATCWAPWSSPEYRKIWKEHSLGPFELTRNTDQLPGPARAHQIEVLSQTPFQTHKIHASPIHSKREKKV